MGDDALGRTVNGGARRHLKWTRAVDDMVALRGDMRFGTEEQDGQLAARCWFESAARANEQSGLRTLDAPKTFICMLVLAHEPGGAGGTGFAPRP